MAEKPKIPPKQPTEAQRVVATGLARGLIKGMAKTLGPEAAQKFHGAMKSVAETIGTGSKPEEKPEQPAQLPEEELTDLQQLVADTDEAGLQELASESETTQSGEEPKEQ